MSATARKRREEIASALKKLIQARGKTPSMKYHQLLDDLRGQSETVNIFDFAFHLLEHNSIKCNYISFLNS